jgi:DNA polymerase-3 subunit delta
LATGADPVPVNAALGNGLRTLAKVAAGRRGTPDVVARDLGLAPFQVKKARAQLAGWTAPRLAAALETVAWADAQIKGGGADPRYALERAVLTIAGGVQETGS